MSEGPYIMEVNEAVFESVVMLAPEEVTVVVDFWAPWCAPCRALTPVLESIAESYDGRVLLAKVNVDQNQQLAAQFQIQGIPAVKIIRGGKIVSEFTGALPEFEIRRIIERFVSTEADDAAKDGEQLLEEGKLDEAAACFQEAVDADPNNSTARLGLAKVALKQGDDENAALHAKAVELGDSNYDNAQAILNRLEFKQTSQEYGGEISAREALEADPGDLDARYALGCCFAAEERYQEALEEFLSIVKRNKQYGEGKAKTAMVKVFSIIGQRSTLADNYRDQLELVLY